MYSSLRATVVEWGLFRNHSEDPHELEGSERYLDCSDRGLILAIARKKLAEAPEYAFRTRGVGQRIIVKLTVRKANDR